MNISMDLPLDDGYLRRECPLCERQFKWHQSNDAPNDKLPDRYYCPYCGTGASPGSWWTKEQLSLAKELATREGAKRINDSLKALEGTSRNGLVNISIKAGQLPTHEPRLLHEPHDMIAVQPPCHPDEPLKVADDWSDALHCLVCGAQFAVQA